jgi:hypothetical protein
MAVTGADVSASQLVVTISSALPESATVTGKAMESWDDVPPASVDYTAASDAPHAHAKKLVDALSTAATPAAGHP